MNRSPPDTPVIIEQDGTMRCRYCGDTFKASVDDLMTDGSRPAYDKMKAFSNLHGSARSCPNKNRRS